jgi:spoIIIJ-associated protein
VAHAEASARTVAAAIAAAAAQLGLRSDQVDVEVLEDPVPSTFGYIGTPARVRVTPRSTPIAPDVIAPDVIATSSSDPASPASAPSQGPGPAAPAASPDVSASSPGSAAAAVPAAGPAPVGAGTARDSAGDAASSADAASGRPGDAAPDPAPGPTAPTTAAAGPPDLAGSSERSAAGLAGIPSPPPPAQVPQGAINSSPQDVSDATNIPNGSPPTSAPPADTEPPGTSPAVESAPADATPAAPSQPAAATEASTAEASPRAAASGTEDGQDASLAAAPAEGATGGATRASRRTYRDEPIAPEMVEEDTERAGDFLEGLLDALDVDGDITTWVDEVGGHIDLEGADLEPLIGPNGETLDSLQELTRLAVLRQSKRRVRLLLDINGFRARQRDQLISMVRTTAEQVIKTREDHELQPMSPAERKIVHDAVAAIDGVQTESLGEDPNRRVVIRPT